jgi:hypothetical protein
MRCCGQGVPWAVGGHSPRSGRLLPEARSRVEAGVSFLLLWRLGGAEGGAERGAEGVWEAVWDLWEWWWLQQESTAAQVLAPVD